MADISDNLRQEIESELDQIFEWREVEAGVNDVYVLSAEGRKLVLKVQTDSGNEIEESVRAEPEIYRIISEETDIPSPGIIYESFTQEGKMFYVMEKMPGINPVEKWDEIPQSNREKLMFDYGRFLGHIHKLRTFEKSGRIEAQREDISVSEGCKWPEKFRQKMEDWRSKINNSNELPEVPEFTEELFHEIPEAQPVLIHEDNRLDNLLVQGSAITAFLDWSGAISGSRKYDLARAEYYLIDGDATFAGKEILTEEQKNLLRDALLAGYRKSNELGSGWIQSDERRIYRYAAILDIASGFNEWGKHFDKKLYQETRRELTGKIKAEQPKELLK